MCIVKLETCTGEFCADLNLWSDSGEFDGCRFLDSQEIVEHCRQQGDYCTRVID